MDIENYQSHAAEDLSRYAICNQREIEQIIQGMTNDRTLVSIQGRRSKRAFLSTFLGVNEKNGRAYLECVEDNPVDEELRLGIGADVSATYKGVRIQFAAPQAERIQFDDLEAYQIELPASLYRFQRREYYRVGLSQVKPALCHIPLGGRELAAKVTNISLGGVGIRYDVDEVAFDAGAEFEGVRLTTPDGETYAVTLKVCNSTVLTLKNDVQVRQVGCQFIKLSKKAERDIQLYIFKLERDQRLAEK